VYWVQEMRGATVLGGHGGERTEQREWRGEVRGAKNGRRGVVSMEENTACAHAVLLLTCVSRPGSTFSKLPTFKCSGFVPGKPYRTGY
jgi:hypothetical protein